MNFVPIHRRILVQKCVEGEEEIHEGVKYYRKDNIVIPEISADTSNWVQLVNIAEDCKKFHRSWIGGFMKLPEYAPQHMVRIGETDYWVVKETIFDDLEKINSYIIVS